MRLSKIRQHLLAPFSPENKQEGMTIIEILIVIALISTIMVVVVGGVMQKNDEGKADLTGVLQSKLAESLSMYKINTARFPSTEEGLQALVEAPSSARNWKGPYTEAEKLDDTFGKPMQYELINPKSFKITSAGIDGEFGTEDDIIYPKEAVKEREKSPVTAELKVPEGNLRESNE